MGGREAANGNRLKDAGFELTAEAVCNVEITDYGFGRLEDIGLELAAYVNTDRYCVKELVMFSG